MRMIDLSPDQRPRERLLAGRGEELSDADLLALLWGTGRRGLSAVDCSSSSVTSTIVRPPRSRLTLTPSTVPHTHTGASDSARGK